MFRTVFVIAKSGTWLVKSDERNHHTQLFTTQKAAVSYGREIAKAMKADLVIRTNIKTLGKP